MSSHDPLRFASSLNAKLATRERHVCLFLGAGAARACGLPDVSQLQDRVLANLSGGDRTAFAGQLNGRNLEGALSRLRRIAALLAGQDQTVDGLGAKAASDLDANVCKEIIGALDISGADLEPVSNLAAWVARADYRFPVEIFTVNYDLLIESGLESQRVPYFDGFIGTLKARFHTDLVEGPIDPNSDRVPAFFVRLWKLHGSVNWEWEMDQQIVRLGHPVTEGRAAAIYPSDAKYEESRRVPFVVLQDRLRRAIDQPESLVVVSGYAFGDAHLNELLFDAATRRERSEFVVFCFNDIPDVLARRAAITPNIQVASGAEGILGGVRGPWRAVPDAPPNLWVDGNLGLRDFRELAAYLARSTTREPEDSVRLKNLLQGVIAAPEAGVAGIKDG